MGPGNRTLDLEFFIRDLGTFFTVIVESDTNQIYARINQL